MQLVIFALIITSVLGHEHEDISFYELYDEQEILLSNVTVTSLNIPKCQVRLRTDTANPQPLFIQPGSELFFHPYDRRGILEFTQGQEIELFCTSVFASPGGISGNLIRISCSSGVRFLFNGISYNFNEFTCRNWPTSVAQRRVTLNRCYNQGTIVDVGFKVESRFLKVFTSCHDPRVEQNVYTEYRLTPANDGQESSVSRPGWRQADFFPGKNVDSLHTRNTQRATIATTLNSTSASEKFIELPNSDVYLARGHLAAMTDFITANEQRSTFFFTNTAPQWQTFNGVNWLAVEMSSRRLAADRNINLDVFTGTFGVTQLRDESGTRQPIFLDFPNRQIPVPMLFFKILINQSNESGVVLIGVNNPHLTLSEILQDYVICNDVSDRIKYVNWQKDDIRRGYSYACEVNNLLSRVPFIPRINVRSLLV